MGKETRALSRPAERVALEVLAANGVETFIQRVDGFTPTPVISKPFFSVYWAGVGAAGNFSL
jgi:phosphoglucomutase